MPVPLWLQLAKGPAFLFVFTILLLGLARLVFLSVWGIVAAVRQAGQRRIPYAHVFKETLSWLVPLNRLHQARPAQSYASFLFHAGLILMLLFLQNHLDILRANFGLAWPALPRLPLNILTFITFVTGAYMLLYRIYISSIRILSKPLDYFLLALILAIFGSGFVAGMPWNPIPYDWLMLFHTVAGLLLLMLIPFTKIAHCVLFPLVRLSSEIAWHFPPHSGTDAIKTLYGPEGRKI